MPPTSLVLVALGQHSVTSSCWHDKCRQPVWSASLSASCVGAVATSERQASIGSDYMNRELPRGLPTILPIGANQSLAFRPRRSNCSGSRRTCTPRSLLQHTISGGSNDATDYRH
uniref:Uncharacterized protein n=1 Tax=Ixodes scapularis TaxID=6945 RepID=A0A4D5S551_IXOSC